MGKVNVKVKVGERRNAREWKTVYRTGECEYACGTCFRPILKKRLELVEETRIGIGILTYPRLTDSDIHAMG